MEMNASRNYLLFLGHVVGFSVMSRRDKWYLCILGDSQRYGFANGVCGLRWQRYLSREIENEVAESLAGGMIRWPVIPVINLIASVLSLSATDKPPEQQNLEIWTAFWQKTHFCDLVSDLKALCIQTLSFPK